MNLTLATPSAGVVAARGLAIKLFLLKAQILEPLFEFDDGLVLRGTGCATSLFESAKLCVQALLDRAPLLPFDIASLRVQFALELLHLLFDLPLDLCVVALLGVFLG